MATQTSQVIAISPDAGYAPEFAVDIQGKRVDERTKSDVLDLRVVLELEQMASFDVTFNNWDDVNLRFKYSETDSNNEVFRFGQLAAIRLGYAGNLVPVVSGQIMGLRPSFPESGSPTIGISGTDGMQKLKDSKPRDGQRRRFPNMADWEIAQEIARRNGMDVAVTKEGPTHQLVVNKNQDEASFLMERAKRIDFDCYVVSDPDAGRQTLHFESPPDGRDGRPVRVFQLAYGPGLAAEESRARGRGRSSSGIAGPLVPNLISFTPTLTAAKQVSRVTVRGWDPRTKKPIHAAATIQDLPSGTDGGLSGPKAAEQTLGGRQDVVIDAPVFSDQEAREYAKALLRERAYQFITGTGRIAGLPELRPRDTLEIHGIGLRFSGNYFVTRVEHTLGSSGFFTQFTVRRVADGSIR